MSDIDLDLDGADRIDERLERMIADLQTRQRWFVGTAVNYAVYLEFGTRDMDPKPFIRPVIVEARRDLRQFVRENTNTTVEATDDVGDLVRTIALALQRRIKVVITEKGLIDTGALRASVAAVPAAATGTLPDESDIPEPEDGLVDDQAVAVREQVEVGV